MQIEKKHEKPINISVKIFGWFAVIAGIAAMFTQFYLPAQIEDDIAEIKWFSLICLLVFGVGTLLLVKYKKYIGVFVFYVLFMTVVSAFATEEFFEVDYRFGQRDLVQFAKYAKENGYDCFSTTLLVSPYQKHEVLIQVAQDMAKNMVLNFCIVILEWVFVMDKQKQEN